jgi:hypothetical protein
MRDDSRHGERLVALFLLGLVLFNPLVLSIFDVGFDGGLFGIPTLYLYLFVVWAVLIGLVALVVENAPKDAVPPPGQTRPTTEPH